MSSIHRFLDHLYELSILSRNGLNVMQEFLRVCERNSELEDQVICKLASYFKSLSASDCYDLSSRLFQNFKQQKEAENSNIVQSQYTLAPVVQQTFLYKDSKKNLENLQNIENKNSNQQQFSTNLNNRLDFNQKKYDWKWKLQVNDKLKSFCNIINKKLYQQGFFQIKQHQNTCKNAIRQLSPQTLKMSTHIKQQLNTFFEQKEVQKNILKNNNIQKQLDQKQLQRNESSEDLKNQYLSQRQLQNTLRQTSSPEALKKQRSNLSISNNLSCLQNNMKQIANSVNSPQKLINIQSINQYSSIKNLKESLNKQLDESNQQLKLNASDVRLNYLNLKESFKLIHEQLEADLITNQEAVQLINSIKQKHYGEFCTFKPNINKENQYYEKIKNRDITNPFERLYKDGVEHKANKSQILKRIKSCLELKDCTFHPNLQKSNSKPRNIRFAGTLSKFTQSPNDFEQENEL
ncbi:hypothetical protein ABPG72_019896 [Tetrahymena utriculariae]